MNENDKKAYYSIDTIYQVGNVGGMANRLRLIPISEILNFKRPKYGEFVLPIDAISYKSTPIIIDIEVAYNSMILSEEMQIDIHGEYFAVKLTAELPKQRPNLTEWIRRNVSREFMAIVKDKNGFVKLLGTPEQPLRFTNVMAQSGRRGGKNMLGIELSASVEQHAYYFDGDNIFDLMSIPNLDNVLLSAIKSGKLAIAFNEVSLSVNEDNQTGFVIPDLLREKPIVSFSVNHIPYSLGIEYNISFVNGIKTIRWLVTDFPIVLTDLVQLKYLEILNIL